MRNHKREFKVDESGAASSQPLPSIHESIGIGDGVDSVNAYQALFENLPVGVYRSAQSGRILDVNPAFVRLLGYPDRATLLKVRSADLYNDPADRDRFAEAMERSESVTDFEDVLRRFDGTPVHVLTTARSERGVDGLVQCYEGIVVDVTERRRDEDRSRLQAAALEAAAGGIVITDSKGTIEWVNPAFTRSRQ
jgi:PAS domain S-box-containing protein